MIDPIEDHRYWQDPLSLRDFDSDHGYILLGDRGMGKTTEVQQAALRCDTSHVMTAQQFLRWDLSVCPDWEIIFIDGVDEVRIGGGDPRIVMDQLIAKLKALGTTKFRITCQNGSWIRNVDLSEFSKILEEGLTVSILQLNPLRSSDIQQILTHRSINVDVFIQKATEKGINTFLGNPHFLHSLIDSISEMGWSDSFNSLYENGCRALFRKPRSDYQDFSPEEVLVESGRIFAYLLIANKFGAGEDTKFIECCNFLETGSSNIQPIHQAIMSYFFHNEDSLNVPIHQFQIEFLAARYLDQKIRDGLSIRRVLGLLYGFNGSPCLDLQGLAGWLATLNHREREILITEDPLSLLCCGNIGDFRPKERLYLLDKLERTISRCSDRPFSMNLHGLATDEGLSWMRTLVSSSHPSKVNQTLILLLLRGISQKYSSTTMKISDIEVLRVIIRDHRWVPKLRCEALLTITRLIDHEKGVRVFLRELITDLKEERIIDETNDLLGTVFYLIYPYDLYPHELFDDLITRSKVNHPSIYVNFFKTLPNHSDPTQLCQLLTYLSDRSSEIIPQLVHHHLSMIVMQILAQCLKLCGNQASIHELFSWFKLVKFDQDLSHLVLIHPTDQQWNGVDRESSNLIHSWLSKHEKIQRELIEYGLNEQKHRIGQLLLDKYIGLKFVGVNAQEEFRLWCVHRAVQLWDSNPSVARELASWSLRPRKGWGPPLSTDVIIKILPRISDELIQRNHLSPFILHPAEERQVDDTKRQEILDQVRKQRIELSVGRCTPMILDQLARVYYDLSEHKSDSIWTGLQSFLEGDQDLVEATLAGFCSLLEREDLPDLDQIMQLFENGQRSYYALPFLAAMMEMQKTCNVFITLTEKAQKRALGFYFITGSSHINERSTKESGLNDDDPSWFIYAMQNDPKIVADSLVSVHNACIRSKHPPVAHLYKFTFQKQWEHIVSYAMPRMFTVFPTRCNATQLESLSLILWCCILHKDAFGKFLLKIITQRLNRKQVDLGQQALWLSAGLMLNQCGYGPRLISFLSKGEYARTRHVVDFLGHDATVELPMDYYGDWTCAEIALMVKEFGRRITPLIIENQPESFTDDQKGIHKFQGLFQRWIQELEKRISQEAIDTLEQLIVDDDLADWKFHLANAQQLQIRHQSALYRSDLTFEQIQNVLTDGMPASPVDLFCIIVEAFETFVERMSDNHTAVDWHQLWEWPRNPDQLPHPKSHRECCDILTSYLKTYLKKYQVDVCHKNKDTRSIHDGDIRISFRSDFEIPISVNKNSDITLWKKMSNQTLLKHSLNPKSYGYRLHVVFWLGAGPDYMKAISPDGNLPRGPEHLRDLLQQNWKNHLNNNAKVIVIDVSQR
ncbi:MAG: hypothetical protein OXF06_05435 [Bacteroidetes bacterium]|nr:hypothetical protein [Bacteroidota bacterium]